MKGIETLPKHQCFADNQCLQITFNYYKILFLPLKLHLISVLSVSSKY